MDLSLSSIAFSLSFIDDSVESNIFMKRIDPTQYPIEKGRSQDPNPFLIEKRRIGKYRKGSTRPIISPSIKRRIKAII